MRISTLIILLTFSTLFQGLGQDLTGTYENDCEEKLRLKRDFTFYYTYPVLHGWNWASGTWGIESNKVCLVVKPVFDTVDVGYEVINQGTDSAFFDLENPVELADPYLITSVDTLIDNYKILEGTIMSISCCGEQLMDFQQYLEIKNDKLVKWETKEYPSCEKLIKTTAIQLSADDVSENSLNEIPPNGKYRYDIAFAEWQGKSMGEKLTVIIKGDSIRVVYEGDGNLSLAKKGQIINQGQIMKHKSGVWIIGTHESDKELDEIGGCTGGPAIIDFRNKKYWMC